MYIYIYRYRYIDKQIPIHFEYLFTYFWHAATRIRIAYSAWLALYTT